MVTMRTATMSEGKKKLPFGLKGQYRNKGLGLQFSAMSKVKGEASRAGALVRYRWSVRMNVERLCFRAGKGKERRMMVANE